MGETSSRLIHFYADVAHLVERHLAKVEVASSSLVIRSNKHLVCFLHSEFRLTLQTAP